MYIYMIYTLSKTFISISKGLDLERTPSPEAPKNEDLLLFFSLKSYSWAFLLKIHITSNHLGLFTFFTVL